MRYVVPPFKSVDITAGKKYEVIKRYDFGVVDIIDDSGAIMTVATEGSIRTFKQPWKWSN